MKSVQKDSYQTRRSFLMSSCCLTQLLWHEAKRKHLNHPQSTGLNKAKAASLKRHNKMKAVKEDVKSAITKDAFREQQKINAKGGNKFAVKKMVLSKNSIVFQKKRTTNEVSESKELKDGSQTQLSINKHIIRAKSLICSPRREPKNYEMKELRTPIIAKFDISTDTSSNLFNSFMNNTENSHSEKRVPDSFKKSNSQELSRFNCSNTASNKMNLQNLNDIKTIVPIPNISMGIKTRCSASAHKIEAKIQQKIDKNIEFDESFRRLFDASASKFQKVCNQDSPQVRGRLNNKDILLDNYFFKLKKRKKEQGKEEKSREMNIV